MGNLILILILFLSRVFFLSPLPIYFDSPEYVRLIENPNLIQALTLGHEPIHPGYILPAWILSRIFPILGVVYSAELVSSIFGTLALFVFYKIIKWLFNKTLAIKSLLVTALLPTFFLASTNVLTDTSYIFFYLFSFYCLLRSRNRFNKWFLLGIFSLGYSIFTHTQVILWFPLFLAPVIFEKKNRFQVFKNVAAFLVLGSILGISSLVLLLMLIGNTPIQGFKLLFMHGADIYGTGNIFYDLTRFVRNFGIILLRNNSTLVILAAALGSILLYRKDKKKLLILFLWFLPAILVTQYWHIGLFGRVALVASFPLAVLTSFAPRLLYFLVVVQLIIMYIPLAIINKNAPIQNELVSLYSTIPQGGVLVSSNLIRPQVVFSGEKYFVNEPGQSLEFIGSEIDLALKNNKNVYIDSQTLYNPYYSYDGNHLHILSLGKVGNSKTEPLFDKYSVEIIKETSNKRIFLYKINPASRLKTDSKSYTYEYGKNFRGRLNHERIDYLDAGMWAWVLLTNKKEPISWKL